MNADDLHPYDGQERRFRDCDEDPQRLARGRTLVAGLLGSPVSAAGLRYDLSYYSGGTGVLDRMFVAMPCASEQIAAMVQARQLLTPGQARAHAEWGSTFDELVTEEDEPEQSLMESVRAFIDDERPSWMPSPTPTLRAWFRPYSDVNSWLVLYEYDGGAGLMAYSQG